jgi:hypothetical protein
MTAMASLQATEDRPSSTPRRPIVFLIRLVIGSHHFSLLLSPRSPLAEKQETKSVTAKPSDLLPRVAPRHDVRDGALKFDPQSPWHVGRSNLGKTNCQAEKQETKSVTAKPPCHCEAPKKQSLSPRSPSSLSPRSPSVSPRSLHEGELRHVRLARGRSGPLLRNSSVHSSHRSR